jgi:hypothetical protein
MPNPEDLADLLHELHGIAPCYAALCALLVLYRASCVWRAIQPARGSREVYVGTLHSVKKKPRILVNGRQRFVTIHFEL